jgi:SSS family solute:Na+ symporter
MHQMNGLYSMPVLAAFLVAVVGRRVLPLALRTGLLFGVGLYAVFTFAWQPFGLHYIHLMAITLASTIALVYALDRVLPGASPVSSGGHPEASSASR